MEIKEILKTVDHTLLLPYYQHLLGVKLKRFWMMR